MIDYFFIFKKRHLSRENVKFRASVKPIAMASIFFYTPNLMLNHLSTFLNMDLNYLLNE